MIAWRGEALESAYLGLERHHAELLERELSELSLELVVDAKVGVSATLRLLAVVDHEALLLVVLGRAGDRGALDRLALLVVHLHEHVLHEAFEFVELARALGVHARQVLAVAVQLEEVVLAGRVATRRH